MLEINKIYHGDSKEVMKTFPDNCIDLTVTSPPYDNLRKYNGFTFDFECIAQQLYRITKEGGVVVWVVADQTKKYTESGTSFKNALYFMSIGFCLFDTIVWEKINPMPGDKNRYTDSFEFMFVFSKGKPKTFNPIMIKCKTAGRNQKWSNRPHESKVWKKDGCVQNRKTKDTKIKGNVWKYGTGKGMSAKGNLAFKHPAIYPEKLAEDHILSWSNPGDLILDPMVGSGTTPKMAIENNRNYIGIDISKKYIDEIINDRIKNAQPKLF